MPKPSRTRDLVGAVLVVLVGALYMTGITDITVEHPAGADTAVEVSDTSAPAPVADLDRVT